MTPPSLPTTRPTSDTYGPDLIDERPVSRPDYELSAAAWNKLKADLAAVSEVAPLAIIRIANNGTASVARQRPTALGTVTVSHISTGHVQITMPGGVLPIDAIVTCVGNGAFAASGSNTYATAFVISGNTIDVYTSNNGGAVDVDFVIEVS